MLQRGESLAEPLNLLLLLHEVETMRIGILHSLRRGVGERLLQLEDLLLEIDHMAHVVMALAFRTAAATSGRCPWLPALASGRVWRRSCGDGGCRRGRGDDGREL